MKLYVTKYALTEDGITEHNKGTYFIENGYAHVNGYHTLFRMGNDAFFDKSDAIRKASDMLSNKIKSLEKQIAKLKGMEFK